MLNDTAELLDGSREEPWYVGKCNNGDLKGIAEANKSSSLNRGIDVEAPGKDLRLIGNDANNSALNFSEADNDVFGVLRHDLIEVISIDDVLDHELHVIGLVGIERHDVVEQSACCLVAPVCVSPDLVGALLRARLRQVSQ